MLSNPPMSGLQARQQRQHRRQNSTPTAFESTKIAHILPNTHMSQQQEQQQQRQQQRPRVSHRRGMSLDTRRQMQSPTTPMRQDFHMVSNNGTNNNTGFASTPQHVLREAQQQRIARPGPQQAAYANLAADENYLVSPNTTPQLPNYGGQCFDGLPNCQNNMSLGFDMYNGPMNVIVKKNQASFGNNSNVTSPDFELFPSSSLSTPTFMTFQDSPNAPDWMSEGESSHSRRNSRRISNGIMDRVSKFEGMTIESPERPLTPPHQNATDYFPLTPMETPHDRTIKHTQQPQRFMEGYDESTEETVKPTRHSAQGRPQTTFDAMRQAAESRPMLSTEPRANTMPLPGTYDHASVASSGYMGHDQLRVDTTFEGVPSPSHPLSANSAYSHLTSPATPNFGTFSSAFDNKPDLAPPCDGLPAHGNEVGSPSTEKPSRRGSPHRRNESVASIASAASIATIDIEQTKTTTGITLDDIQQYIAGPEAIDQKWVCLFDGCRKRFGRKENIKSHVQTHLNDRQYQCPSCHKCFVRQHDLKRHAKIHTGLKPYPCECGNSFARHDALTRHRQRGMCVGAFEGVVRKTVKRGRPRKHRPDMEERKEKATRTRRKVKSVSSISSQSGYSDSSVANSPEEHVDRDWGMFDDLMDTSIGGTTMNPSGLQSSSAPMPSLAVDPPLSAHSPSAGSVHSYVSQLSHMSLHPEPFIDPQQLPSHPASPAKSTSSQFNEPPELSQSSSPPQCNQYFESEPNSSGLDAMVSSATDVSNIASMVGLPTDDSDLLLQFPGNDSSMLMLGASEGKYDDFDNVEMFTNDGDFIFGN
ncbi:hypothetical protein F5Y15DRAFT_423717 [Xylariaceae sp. FL0016]|nr:hypothetical protein F5Y15DRAFT_423717 [Xylariaceae sp. FL0016]